MAQPDVEIILLKQLASCLAMPMFVINPDGDLLYFNESAEPLLGLRFDELVGNIGLDEWPALLRMTDERGGPIKEEARALPAALTTRAPVYRRVWLQGRDGERRSLQVTGIPLIAHDGRLLGALGLFWEDGAHPLEGLACEKCNGQQEVEVILMKSLASYLAVPIFLVDQDGELLYFNEAAEAILGRRFKEVASSPIMELYSAIQPRNEEGVPIEPEDHPLWSARLRLEPAHGRLLIQGYDAVQRRIEVSAIPLVGQSDRMLGAVGFFWEQPAP
jgi:PAS domain-containing protein